MPDVLDYSVKKAVIIAAVISELDYFLLEIDSEVWDKRDLSSNFWFIVGLWKQLSELVHHH